MGLNLDMAWIFQALSSHTCNFEDNLVGGIPTETNLSQISHSGVEQLKNNKTFNHVNLFNIKDSIKICHMHMCLKNFKSLG